MVHSKAVVAHFVTSSSEVSAVVDANTCYYSVAVVVVVETAAAVDNKCANCNSHNHRFQAYFHILECSASATDSDASDCSTVVAAGAVAVDNLLLRLHLATVAVDSRIVVLQMDS